MKKLTVWVIISTCAIEIGLAVYRVPVANFSLLVVITVAGLVGLALIKLMAAMLRDRDKERQAFVKLAQIHSQDYRHSFNALVQANAHQVALVEQCLAMGGILMQARSGQYYATLPGGQHAPLEVVEAEYWQELAPQRVAGRLPAASSSNTNSNKFRHPQGDK